MKTLLLISSLFLTIGLNSQSEYEYKLKLENSPAKFFVTRDSISSEKSIKLYVTDFSNYPLSFCGVKMIVDNITNTFTTNADGYLFLKPGTANWKLVITYPTYSTFELNSGAISESTSSVLKVMMTFEMASKTCKIISSKRMDTNEVNQIVKKFSANPFDPEILESKAYNVICNL